MKNSPSRLGFFLLVRLAAQGNPPDPSALDRALKSYFACRLGLSDGQWRTLLANTLEELSAGDWIEQKPYRLTAIGREECRRFLDVAELPEGNWLHLRNRQLMAKALGIKPQSDAEWKRLASADGLRAAVLVKFYELPIDPLPTPHQALKALAERQLPDHSEQKRTSREALLREALIPDQPGELKLKICLPAAVTKAGNTSTESLRRAVINRWLNGCDASEYTILQTSSDPSRTDADLDVRTFALQVQELAGQATFGRFGENKVFLSHLWEDYHRNNSAAGITREEFDGLLLEANRLNLITLSRADLISAMDPRDVEASEISLPHATFHFIRTDGTHEAETDL